MVKIFAFGSFYRSFQRIRILKRLKKYGENFIFDVKSIITDPNLVSVGNNVYIGDMAYISAELSIGNNVMFGPFPAIIGGDHFFGVEGKSVRFLKPKERENCKPIVIEDEVWCGARVTILKGVTIGIGAVIGAGSIVTKSIPPFTIAAGNKCAPIKCIFSDEKLGRHLIKLNYSSEFTGSILNRRKIELGNWGLSNLDYVDQTSDYWETSQTLLH